MYDWVSSQKNIQGDSTKSNKKLEKEGFRQVFFSWQRGLVLIQISRKWELHPRDIIMWSQKREAAFWQFFFWFADIIYVLSADDLIQIWRWGKEFFSRQITGWQQEFFGQNNLDFWTFGLDYFFLAKAGLEKIFQAMWPQGLICYVKQHSAICPGFFRSSWQPSNRVDFFKMDDSWVKRGL